MKPPVLHRTGSRPNAADADLAQLLRLAAVGDVDAFLAFYDATIRMVHGYARLRYDDEAAVDAAVCRVYARAWATAADYPGSGLSVRPWLLCHDGSR
jgi:RNA polymerase sigma-70 factor (ECF subfamily)